MATWEQINGRTLTRHSQDPGPIPAWGKVLPEEAELPLGSRSHLFLSAV